MKPKHKVILKITLICILFGILNTLSFASSESWLDEMKKAVGLSVGDLNPIDIDFGDPQGTATGGGGETGTTTGDTGQKPVGPNADKPIAPGTGQGGATAGTGDPGGPVKVNPDALDPVKHADVATLIREWLSIAQPPKNAVPGNNFYYDQYGRMLGTGIGMIATSNQPPDYPGATPEAKAWINLRKGLDSIDHCTLEEYVVAKLEGLSIDYCRGRYTAVRNLKGMSFTAAEAAVKAAGLIPITIPNLSQSQKMTETVEKQDPNYDQHFKRGQAVKLYITGPYSAGTIIIKDITITGASGRGKPAAGQTMKAAATIVMGELESPQLSIKWQRMSDSGKRPSMQVIKTVKNGSVQVQKEFDSQPKSRGIKYDWLEIAVSDGFEPDPDVSKRIEFEWEESDEFLDFDFKDAGGRKGLRFEMGEKITVTGTWKIANDKDSGPKRHIKYLANGTAFFEGDVSVQPGRKWTHDAVIDTAGLVKGKVTIKAELSNALTGSATDGKDKFMLVTGKDEITHAQADTVQGVKEKGRNFSGTKQVISGNTIYINARILAAKNLDGKRTLGVTYHGKSVMSYDIDMKGGTTTDKSFEINTGKLDADVHRFEVYLTNKEGNQDSRKLRIRVKEDPNASTGSAGGMQNVSCTGDKVSIMVWDHGSQDNDIITLTIGGRQLLSSFDLNGCGGSEPGCSLMDQPFPAGSNIPVTVYAHNEGSSSPNTASLKVEGGCTPELQNWGLKTGESASIFISRSTAQQQQGTGQAIPQYQGQQAPVQQTTQSWP